MRLLVVVPALVLIAGCSQDPVRPDVIDDLQQFCGQSYAASLSRWASDSWSGTARIFDCSQDRISIQVRNDQWSVTIVRNTDGVASFRQPAHGIVTGGSISGSSDQSGFWRRGEIGFGLDQETLERITATTNADSVDDVQRRLRNNYFRIQLDGDELSIMFANLSDNEYIIDLSSPV